jgi:hypothetical protein
MMTSKKLSNLPFFLHLLMEKMLGICCKALIYSNLLFMVKTQSSVNGLLVFCVWGDLSPWCRSKVSSFLFWDSKVDMKNMSWFCVFWTWILVVCKWVFMKHKRCNIVDGIIIDFFKNLHKKNIVVGKFLQLKVRGILGCVCGLLYKRFWCLWFHFLGKSTLGCNTFQHMWSP